MTIRPQNSSPDLRRGLKIVYEEKTLQKLTNREIMAKACYFFLKRNWWEKIDLLWLKKNLFQTWSNQKMCCSNFLFRFWKNSIAAAILLISLFKKIRDRRERARIIEFFCSIIQDFSDWCKDLFDCTHNPSHLSLTLYPDVLKIKTIIVVEQTLQKCHLFIIL